VASVIRVRRSGRLSLARGSVQERQPDPEPQNYPAREARTSRRLSLAVRWGLITAGGYAAGLVASVLSVPAPYLLAPLALGVVLALSGAIPGRIPGPINRCSTMLVGALMGSYLTPAALMAAAPLALPLTAVTAVTVVLSLAGGLGLARAGGISQPSALLGVVPGGSAAIVSCAEELKADARLVAFTQYLRVGLVATTAPLIAGWLASRGSAAARNPDGGSGLVPRMRRPGLGIRHSHRHASDQRLPGDHARRHQRRTGHRRLRARRRLAHLHRAEPAATPGHPGDTAAHPADLAWPRQTRASPWTTPGTSRAPVRFFKHRGR
jgi:membrane AbrB-like protein